MESKVRKLCVTQSLTLGVKGLKPFKDFVRHKFTKYRNNVSLSILLKFLMVANYVKKNYKHKLQNFTFRNIKFDLDKIFLQALSDLNKKSGTLKPFKA